MTAMRLGEGWQADVGVLRVLMIGVHHPTARPIYAELQCAFGDHVHLVEVGSLSDGLMLMAEQRFDAILANLDVPDSPAEETYCWLQLAAPQVPIVILSGENGTSSSKPGKLAAGDKLATRDCAGSALMDAVRCSVERQHYGAEREYAGV